MASSIHFAQVGHTTAFCGLLGGSQVATRSTVAAETGALSTTLSSRGNSKGFLVFIMVFIPDDQTRRSGLSPTAVQQPNQAVERIDVGHPDTQLQRDLLDHADQCLVLQPPTGFQILQH